MLVVWTDRLASIKDYTGIHLDRKQSTVRAVKSTFKRFMKGTITCKVDVRKYFYKAGSLLLQKKHILNLLFLHHLISLIIQSWCPALRISPDWIAQLNQLLQQADQKSIGQSNMAHNCCLWEKRQNKGQPLPKAQSSIP